MEPTPTPTMTMADVDPLAATPTASTSASTSVAPGTNTLPTTGMNSTWLIVLALLAFIAGSLVILAIRRSRRA